MTVRANSDLVTLGPNLSESSIPLGGPVEPALPQVLVKKKKPIRRIAARRPGTRAIGHRGIENFNNLHQQQLSSTPPNPLRKYKIVRVIKRKRRPGNGTVLTHPPASLGHHLHPIKYRRVKKPLSTSLVPSQSAVDLPVQELSSALPPFLNEVSTTSNKATTTSAPSPPASPSPVKQKQKQLQQQANEAVKSLSPTSKPEQHALGGEPFEKVTVSRNVTFSHPKGGIVHYADASGLVSTSQYEPQVKPPPLTKEVLEWLARGRITRNQVGLEQANEIEQDRFGLMMQRQAKAAQHLRLSNKLDGFQVAPPPPPFAAAMFTKFEPLQQSRTRENLFERIRQAQVAVLSKLRHQR